MIICSKGAEKYFRRGLRLNWPEGAVSRESIRAVNKLDRLKVTFPRFFYFLFFIYFILFYFYFILNQWGVLWDIKQIFMG